MKIRDRSKKKLSFKVTLEKPPGVTISEIRQYIVESVRSWKGGGDPDEAIFSLDSESVKVSQIHITKGKREYVGHS